MALRVVRTMYRRWEVWEIINLGEVFCHHLLQATSGGYNQDAYDGCIECLEESTRFISKDQRPAFWEKWQGFLDTLDVMDPMADALRACKEIAAEIALSGINYKSRLIYVQ